MDNVTDLELTNEMKLALGACHAIDIKKEFLFTPANFRKTREDGSYIIPKEKWIVFKLRPLSGLELQSIKDSCSVNKADALTGEEFTHFQDALFKMRCLKISILKWNFLYDQEFKRFAEWNSNYSKDGSLTDEALSLLSPILHQEIWLSTMLNQTLTEAELVGLNF